MFFEKFEWNNLNALSPLKSLRRTKWITRDAPRFIVPIKGEKGITMYPEISPGFQGSSVQHKRSYVVFARIRQQKKEDQDLFWSTKKTSIMSINTSFKVKICALCRTAILDYRGPTRNYSKILGFEVTGVTNVTKWRKKDQSNWCFEFIGCIANKNW